MRTQALVATMATNTVIENLRGKWREFRTAEGGNTVIIFALAVLPLFGAAGAAVDYSRANSVKASMQAALDSTALMLSREAAGLNQTQLDKKATDYFTALFNRPEAYNITVKPTYTAASSQVLVTGSGTVKTSFMGVMGIREMAINTDATARWGTTRLRVALALDTTGSMADNNKIGQLKIATKDLLKTLQAAAQTPGDIDVAIVPFANGVNVGTSNVKETWLDWSYYKVTGGGGWGDNYSSSSNNNNYTSSSYNNWGGGGWSSSWGGDSSSSWGGGSSSTDKSKWQGCVMDRDQDYDVKNTAPGVSLKSTLFPAVYSTWCPTSLMPLSHDWTALATKVDALVAVGSTNQTIGLAWAWQALSAGEPFNVTAPSADTTQVIILLSDGLNTENRWTTDATKIDDRMKKACDNVKAAGIQIYTILVMAGNSSVLQKCASKPEMYFQLTAASQMVDTFKTIGTKLSKLRIAD
jgi:Flp pilus assembly protein TadG